MAKFNTELRLALEPEEVEILLASAKRLLPWRILPLSPEDVTIKIATLQLKNVHKNKFVQLAPVIKGAMRTRPMTPLTFSTFAYHRFSDMDNTVYLTAMYTPTPEYTAWLQRVKQGLKRIQVSTGLRTASGTLHKEKLQGKNEEVVVPIAVSVPVSVAASRVGHLPDAETLSIPAVPKLSPGTISIYGPGATDIAKFFSGEINEKRSRIPATK